MYITDILMPLSFQQTSRTSVHTEMLGLSTEQILMRVEWRYVSVISGEQCVTANGTQPMPQPSANNWDYPIQEVSLAASSCVSKKIMTMATFFFQWERQLRMHTSELEREP